MTAIERAMARLRELGADRSGAVAMIFGLGFLCLVLMTGFGIDYYRWAVARSETQHVVDGAALSAAASHKKTEEELQVVVDAHVAANESNMFKSFVNAGIETATAYDEDQQVDVTIQGEVNTLFMGLIGVHTMPLNVNAIAQRGEAEAVELVLVLDNTWSMSESAGGGVSKIAALKSASENLVNELKENEEADVKISVVPYADYVNVGTGSRGKPWVSVPADYSTTSKRDCKTISKKRVCTGGSSTTTYKTCTGYTDGIPYTYSCNTTTVTAPPTCVDVPVTSYEQCSGGTTTNNRWYGCVGSRRTGTLRLNDTLPTTPYPGFLATSQNCLNPVVPLTDDKSTVVNAIRGMIVNVGGYKPSTYIPGGLIWGINMLSPTEPFSEGRPYSANNREPRKIMVLMTDGANTMRYSPSDGRHVGIDFNSAAAPAQVTATNADTSALCAYAKSRGIELYSVALAVDSAAARTMLQNCATNADFYFNASNTTALGHAFRDIAASINRVRLVK